MIGKTVSHYKIIEELGRGGMGIVYKARDIKLDRDVALKFLPLHFGLKAREKERFIHEAKAASALQHHNICTIHEIDEAENGQMFICMDWYKGETLKNKIEKGPLQFEEAIRIAVQIAEGLSHAHQNDIVHRDIKPANIFITQDGIVKILDFGLAKLRGKTKLTVSGTTLGTVAYMSPEQARGEEVDYRTDIWSMGVVLYEMLARQLPFRGEYDQAVIYSILHDEPDPINLPDTPVLNKIINIINKALAKKPSDRFESMQSFLDALRKISEDTSQKRISFSTRPYKKKKISIVAAVTAMLFVLVAVVIFSRLSRKEIPAWMHKDVPLKRLTNEAGEERGKISPDGKYIVYQDESYHLQLKMLSTNETRKLVPSESADQITPSWSPDGEYVTFCHWGPEKRKIIISSLMGNIRQVFEVEGIPYCPEISPDGRSLVYIASAPNKMGMMVIMDIDGSNLRSYSIKGNPIHPAWCADSRYLAFIEFHKLRMGTIRILDIETGKVSEPLKGAEALATPWWIAGLAWSPDARYLVYVGYIEDNLELLSIPIELKNFTATGPPEQITRLQDLGMPFWPSFTRDGKQLCLGIERGNQNIYVMEFDHQSSSISGTPIPVATSLGWDYDPCWMPDGDNILYFSSSNNECDLYRYSMESKETRRLTFTKTNKSNTQISPDGQLISYYSENSIWAIPVSGGPAKRLTPASMKISEPYIWPPDGQDLVLTCEDSSLEIIIAFKYHLEDHMVDTLLTGLYSSCADFDFSPDGQYLVVSGIRVPSDGIDLEEIAVNNWANSKMTSLRTQMPMQPRGRISWTDDSQSIIHEYFDLKGERVYELLALTGESPKRIKLDRSGLNGNILLHRISPSGDKILVCVITEDADMWVLGREKD